MATAPKAPYAQRHYSPAQLLPDAKARFADTRSNDPFPDIPPALLNSADLFDYICQTGMVVPFEGSRLKSASCALRVGAKVIYWEGGAAQDRDLQPGEEFELKPNSLIFFTTEEVIQLPDYMALRFNLHIEFVHKGLLLGTGPLVDPGFHGRLLIPLHNFTTNVYHFRRGEEIIWVEFTKISPNPRWASSTVLDDIRISYNLCGEYKEFDPTKEDQEPWDYLNKAMRKWKDGPRVYSGFQNSLPEAIEQNKKMASSAQEDANKAKNHASSARKEANRIKNIAFSIGGISFLAILLGVLSLYADYRTAVTDADKLASGAETKIEDQKRALSDTKRDVEHFQSQISQISKVGIDNGSDINGLKETIYGLMLRIEELEKRIGKHNSPKKVGKSSP